MNLIYLLNSAEDFFEIENLKLNKKAKERFHLFFSKINFPMTLYIEQFCNDKDYSDIFYNFYSSKFQFPSKYTKRLMFFEGVIKKEDILNQDFNLEDRLIGIMVLRPIKNQIGKVLINPQKLKIDGFIRTTSLEIGCCGRKMCLESFPFSAQDSEFMSCAETTLWSILNYYGTRYPEYKTALPHEIVKISDENGYQRVLPSSGLNYMMSSLILKKFGFASKIYYRLIENKTEESEINFKRWFHYYVESGIPIMVGIKFEGENIGHAISCVGHGKIHVDLNRSYKIDNFEIYNSADFIHEYIYMDDNRIPFEISEFDKFNTELRGCEQTIKAIDVKLANEEDFYTEYLDNILSIKIVKDVNEAIEHINTHSSGHSEAIITENYTIGEKFLNGVDSACVYINASTRFTDGGEFGFGAEVGISTNKLHSRGPMGINDLTTYKFKIYGNGHARE